MANDLEARAHGLGRRHTKLPVLTWTLLGLLFIWLVVWFFFQRPTTEERLQVASFARALREIEGTYVAEVDREALYRAAMASMVRSLGDKYSTYLSPAQMQRVEPGAGSPAYSEGRGVVLDVLHPHDEATGSGLVVRGVFWNERVRQQVLAGGTDTSFSIGVLEERQVVANVYFHRLPSAAHTYMLTIGTSAEPARIRVRIGGYFLSPSQLVASPTTSEVRALFSYEAGSYDNELVVLIQMSSIAESDDHVYFHHVQLAQLD